MEVLSPSFLAAPIFGQRCGATTVTAPLPTSRIRRVWQEKARASRAVGTDYNNDRAIDIVVTRRKDRPRFSKTRAKASFPARPPWSTPVPAPYGSASPLLDFDHDGWMDVAFHAMGPLASPLAQRSWQELRIESSFPRRTGSAPGASPLSTTTTTAGLTWSPWARPPTAKAKSASSAISGPMDSKTSLPMSAWTRFNSKTRAPSSPPTTTATAPPTC